MRTLGTRMDSGETVGFDYLRLGLAIAVMVWHTFPLNYGRQIELVVAPTLISPLVRIIMPLFFSLSGFLVVSSLERLNKLGPFLFNRAIRIGPALVVEVMLSALVIGPLVTEVPPRDYFTDRKFFIYFANMIGWIHYLLPGVFQNNPDTAVNGSLWTVPFELECYLALGGLFLLRRYVAIESALIAGIAIASVWLLFTWPADLWKTLPAVPGRLLTVYFLAGALVFKLRHRLPTSPLIIMIALGMSVLTMLHPKLTAINPLVVAFTAASLGCTTPPKFALLRTGDYSYGIYLYAYPMQQVAVQLLGAGKPMETLFMALVCVSFFAVFSWHFIEKRALRLKRYWFAERSQKAPSHA